MKLASGRFAGAIHDALHLALDGGFAPVDLLAARHRRPSLHGLTDVADLFRLGTEDVEFLRAVAADGVAARSGDFRYAPPVSRPGKIICVGLNYAEHIAEAGRSRPERIVLFPKFPTCLVGHDAPVVRPVGLTSELDYEGELAVVIGRRTRHVSAADALDHVGGYTIMNDVSARDLQRTEPQWIRGKAQDTFAPLGPVVLDAAAAPDIAELRIRTTVNGELRQNASCAQMITPVPEIIEYVSRSITLEPGDVIATGTPSGVGLGMKPPVYLTDGDTVTVEIDGIGTLTNPIVDGT
jgi:2-keto-4-pentenoate hydratase/2-oxohepta-3-ene-1,7-dioic acid hydratase in catechol pathway